MDVQYGVPAKTDLKSLVWYQPAAFEEAGYTVPETFEDFVALIDQMAADGGAKPLCVGIESGQATGWTYTDWVEDMMLRLHGGEDYDAWVANELAFDDPKVQEAMQAPVDLWTEDNVFAAGGSIAATALPGQRSAARRRAVLHAPPGELLRRPVPRGHDLRRPG